MLDSTSELVSKYMQISSLFAASCYNKACADEASRAVTVLQLDTVKATSSPEFETFPGSFSFI